MFDFIFCFFKEKGLDGVLLHATSALVASIMIVLFVIIVGYLINKLECFQMIVLSRIFKPKTAFIICNYFTVIGVILHELSHATAAWLTGAKITEIKLFELNNTGRLGHVNFRTTGSKLQQHLQMTVTSCAPVLSGSILSYVLIRLLILYNLPFGVNAVILYLLISIIDHMSMSKEDLKCYFRGLIFVYPIVFLICWFAFYIMV